MNYTVRELQISAQLFDYIARDVHIYNGYVQIGRAGYVTHVCSAQLWQPSPSNHPQHDIHRNI